MVKLNNGKFKLKECCDQTPRLAHVKYGTKVIYQGHVYIKLSKRSENLDAGIILSVSKGHSILFNPVYGTIHTVESTKKVVVIEYCEDLLDVYIVPADQLGKYLRW